MTDRNYSLTINSMKAVEITLTSKKTATSGAEWAEYHFDTYDFTTLVARDDSMTLLVVPAKNTSMRVLVEMLSHDGVAHRVVERLGRVA